jgi:hypothetical protein
MGRLQVVSRQNIRGPQGLPGVNAIPADEFIADRINDDASDTYAAIAAGFMYAQSVTHPRWGAVPNDPTAASANRIAFQAALNAHSRVYVPPGLFYLDGRLFFNDFNALVGMGPHGGEASSDGSSQLVFTHSGSACFAAQDTTTSLNHVGFMGLTIRVTGAATWVWDFKTLAGLKMAFIRVVTSDDATGGFRSEKINPGDSSWTVNWMDVEIRLTDTSTAYSVDTDFSDAAIVGGSFTGGKGIILRGTGGVRLNTRIDRSTGYGVTISNETESKSQHIITGCEIEENDLGGVLVDGDADDTLVETWCQPIISNNYFRNPGAPQDILFRNLTGPALTGGMVAGNSHNVSTVTPLSVSGSWTRITTGPGSHASTSNNQPRMYLGSTFRQPTLVLSRGGTAVSHTGNTTETTLVTIPVPANAMGTSGQLVIHTLWSVTNNANSKTLRVKLGGTTLGSNSVGAQATVSMLTRIANRSSASQQVGMPGNFAGVGNSTGAVTTGTVDTTAAQDITITAQLANAADTITLESYLVEIIPSSS